MTVLQKVENRFWHLATSITLENIKVTLFQGSAKILYYLEDLKLSDYGLGIFYAKYSSVNLSIQLQLK